LYGAHRPPDLVYAFNVDYDGVAGEYERGRPAYAEAAIRHLIERAQLDRGATVLDLGAGTGKLSRMLDAVGLSVIAVDPSTPMLAELQAAAPRVRTLVGRAESIPLERQSVDAVVAAQAFHWFDAASALPEAHRVLKPGCVLALLWNRRDATDPTQLLLAELTDPPERQTPRGWQLDIPSILRDSGLFSDAELFEFGHAQPTDEAALLDRLRSSSYVAALPAGRRRALEQRLRNGLAELGSPRQLAYETLLYVARRR
jgi:SAM-dependent methyltransferase